MENLYAFLDAILPFSFLSFKFMKNALLCVLLLTPMLGLLGGMAINQRMAFFSDALGHSALAGAGLGLLLGVTNETVSLLLFGVLFALAVTYIRRRGRASADTVISVFSSTSIALGLLILSRGGGFSKFSALLVGDVLAVRAEDLGMLLVGLIVFLGVWAALYNPLLQRAVSADLAASRGTPVRTVDYAFAGILALVVMLSIRYVGMLLINALLVLPAAAARNAARTLCGHAALSVAFALISGVGGLILSYYLNTSAGAAIVLCAALLYFVTLGLSRARK